MRYTPSALIKAEIRFRNNFYINDYTAKIIKTLLINGNPKLSEIFTVNTHMPKPIHITPLFIEENGKKKAIYPKYIPPHNTAQFKALKQQKETTSIKIFSSKKYVFYVGINIELLDDLLKGLSNVDSFIFGNETIEVEDISIHVDYIDIAGESSKIWNDLANGKIKHIKIVFESPTLLKKPLVVLRHRKKKTFNPMPEAVFSVPLYMSLADSGRLRLYRRCVMGVASIFDDTYAIRRTVDLIWYLYDNKWLPALIGYAKYVIDYETLKHIQTFMQSKYGADFTEILAKSLVLARIYGVGDGRATGFGHVALQLLSN